MLHVGEVKFTPGSVFLEINVPFTSGCKLKIPPRGELDILTFLHDILNVRCSDKLQPIKDQ